MRHFSSRRFAAVLLASALAVLLPGAPAFAAVAVVASGLTLSPAVPDLVDALDTLATGHAQTDLLVPTSHDLRSRLDGGLLAPPTLLRVGIGRTLELRAQADTPTPLTAPAAFESPLDAMRRLHGFTDVSFGAKWRVRGGDAGWLPGVAWLANVETTTGSPAFRGADFRPSLRATAEWTLAHDVTVGLMPGVFRDRDDHGKHYGAGVLALTLGQAWTPRLRGFVELAGQRLSHPSTSPYHGMGADLDTGVAFAATSRLQVAAVVSRGFMNTARDARGGLSISARF